MTIPIGAPGETAADIVARQCAAAGGFLSSGSDLPNLTDDDKAVIKAAFGQRSIGRTYVGVASDIDEWRDMGKLQGKMTTTSLRRAFGDFVDTDPQLAKINDVLRTREAAELDPASLPADAVDAAGDNLSNLTDDDTAVLKAAFGQNSLRTAAPQVAITLELARDLGTVKAGERLTTASLRSAFGNAVDDPDSQLNKIYTVLLNRELGHVDTLA